MFHRIAIGLALCSTAAAAPVTVVHQGRLFDITGNPLEGVHDLSVRLYSAADATSAEWSETHADVLLEDGYYTLALGSVTTLDSQQTEAAWLGITVDTGAELLPRQTVHRTRDGLSAFSCESGEVPRMSSEGWVCGVARTHLGTLQVQVSQSGSLSSTWTEVSTRTSLAFNWDQYSEFLRGDQQLYARLCMSYTDSGDNSAYIGVRLRDLSAGTVYYEQNFGNTWSGSGLVHSDCRGWAPVSELNGCQIGVGECDLAMRHTQGRNTNIYRVWWEVSAL